MNKKQRTMLIRILAAAALLVALHFLPVTGAARFFAYLVPYLLVGYDILCKAGKGIRNRQVFDECFLMAVATVGAIALALWEGSGDYTEAIAVMLFYQVGEWFQSYAVGKSRRNISDLMDIRPDYANVEREGRLIQVDPDEVEIGTVILVQPGEKVPIDGVVMEGTSTLNTAALTGESLPRDIQPGEEIISGCINLTGLLKVRTTKEFGASTVSKILDLVENASSRKARSEAFISRFARVYTPAVCGAALALAILPPLVRMGALSLAPLWGEERGPIKAKLLVAVAFAVGASGGVAAHADALQTAAAVAHVVGALVDHALDLGGASVPASRAVARIFHSRLVMVLSITQYRIQDKPRLEPCPFPQRFRQVAGFLRGLFPSSASRAPGRKKAHKAHSANPQSSGRSRPDAAPLASSSQRSFSACPACPLSQ